MKIGVLLADAFQDSEYLLPKFAIESTGAQTEVISLGCTRLPVFDEYPRVPLLPSSP
jgi:putative intracellular protease/amidase